MTEITLTEEQTICISAARDTRESLLINALAGAAKTTTLVHIAKALRVEPTLCVAFNKRIATEMATRMPSFVTCQTMNSLGHQVWGRAVPKRLNLQTDKSYNIMKEVFLGVDRPTTDAYFAPVLKGTRIAKSAGYVPPGQMRKLGTTLCEIDELMDTFAQQLDVDPDDAFIRYLNRALEISIAEAYQSIIDFDDQIYMSTLFGGQFPKYATVMVDEAQDLSPLNHEMLRKLNASRYIAVGDPHQAIYAFRGASHTSMAELRDQFKMRELTLSTSFRCPRAVAENVHWWVPHMRSPDWAKPGTVKHLTEWGASDIPDGAAIICRNNAPIFGVAMKLIRQGRGIKILGNDVGAGLIKLLEKLGPGDTKAEAARSMVLNWEEKELRKAHKARHTSIRDKAECLLVFVGSTATIDEAIAYAKTIFAASGPIQLMTGHKSKGGEWETVFHLDPFLVPSKWTVKAAMENGDEAQLIQEKNLKYVIDTRSMSELFYVNSEDFH